MKNFKLAVLMGGISSEREVSLVSGKHVAESLAKNFDVESFILNENKLPAELSPQTHIVFPAMHGEYGEDGALQKELEDAGFSYAGTSSAASRICMNKPAAKALMMQAQIPVSEEIIFDAANKPSANAAVAALGRELILKPADKGSSVGLKKISNESELQSALGEIACGFWMLEKLFRGREFSVGVIGGKAAGIVEIVPEGGVYDFTRKYTAGSTRYEFPAKLSAEEEKNIKKTAELAFETCACRDFARADFLMNGKGEFIVMEINTLPGMTPTSLLPKSASCVGYTFDALCAKMLEGAIQRFNG